MCGICIIMRKNKPHTIMYCVEDILKPFENSDGEIEIGEGVNPAFVMFIVAILGLCKRFLLVLTDTTCPICGEKLHRHKKVILL